MNEWISVKDRLPSAKDRILFYESDGIFIGHLTDYTNIGKSRKWCSSNGIHSGITHWMPLPEPPENTNGI